MRHGMDAETLVIEYGMSDGSRVRTVRRGTTNAVRFDVREICKTAAAIGAEYVLVAHNHPSGNAAPSEADVIHTKCLSLALKAIRVNFAGHVVIAERGESWV